MSASARVISLRESHDSGLVALATVSRNSVVHRSHLPNGAVEISLKVNQWVAGAAQIHVSTTTGPATGLLLTMAYLCSYNPAPSTDARQKMR